MKRLIIKDNDAYYHCMSRTVNGGEANTRVRFTEVNKEVFRRMIRTVADFSGVEVLTYCVMGNHFHVLLRVPCDAREISDTELVRRYKVLYPKPTPYQPMAFHRLEQILEDGGLEAESVRREILRRMGDVSEYMKNLKQRFSVYFNRTHSRLGTLWSERFKSVLIEGERHALQTVAAYIDLNPVRAGLVDDPKDYRFCSYAEAVVGRKNARKGVAHTLEGMSVQYHPRHLAHYRMLLFGTGAEKSRTNTGYISREEAVRVLERERGKLPLATLLRCRARYFTDGWVLGSAKFIYRVSGNHLRKSSQKLPIKESESAEEGLCVGKGFRGAVLS